MSFIHQVIWINWCSFLLENISRRQIKHLSPSLGTRAIPFVQTGIWQIEKSLNTPFCLLILGYKVSLSTIKYPRRPVFIEFLIPLKLKHKKALQLSWYFALTTKCVVLWRFCIFVIFLWVPSQNVLMVHLNRPMSRFICEEVNFLFEAQLRTLKMALHILGLACWNSKMEKKCLPSFSSTEVGLLDSWISEIGFFDFDESHHFV